MGLTRKEREKEEENERKAAEKAAKKAELAAKRAARDAEKAAKAASAASAAAGADADKADDAPGADAADAHAGGRHADEYDLRVVLCVWQICGCPSNNFMQSADRAASELIVTHRAGTRPSRRPWDPVI